MTFPLNALIRVTDGLHKGRTGVIWSEPRACNEPVCGGLHYVVFLEGNIIFCEPAYHLEAV